MPTVIDEYYIEEFWRQSGRSTWDECWEWTGPFRPDGYGSYTPIVHQGKRIQKAPNIVWVLVYGEIPDDMFILHHCDNRKCVNINHLFLGTQGNNMQDMHAKGRGRGYSKNV